MVGVCPVTHGSFPPFATLAAFAGFTLTGIQYCVLPVTGKTNQGVPYSGPASSA